MQSAPRHNAQTLNRPGCADTWGATSWEGKVRNLMCLAPASNKKETGNKTKTDQLEVALSFVRCLFAWCRPLRCNPDQIEREENQGANQAVKPAPQLEEGATFSIFYGICMDEHTCEAKLPHINVNVRRKKKYRGAIRQSNPHHSVRSRTTVPDQGHCV